VPSQSEAAAFFGAGRGAPNVAAWTPRSRRVPDSSSSSRRYVPVPRAQAAGSFCRYVAPVSLNAAGTGCSFSNVSAPVSGSIR